MTAQGPTLAECEALHDGEPVFGWIWTDGEGVVETLEAQTAIPAVSSSANAFPAFSRARAREADQ